MSNNQHVYKTVTDNNKRQIGIFFKINDNFYATRIDYRSKERFKKLLEGFSKNAKICEPQPGEKFEFIELCDILNSAHNNLDKKQRATKLIFTLMAQNSCSIFH